MKQSKNITRICKICFKEIYINNLHSFLFNVDICSHCLTNLNPVFKYFKIETISALALYEYNETLKKLIYQFKGCKDFELRSVFLTYFLDNLKSKYKNYYILPIPSYVENDIERGFNHVEEIYKPLGLPILKGILVKKRNENQHLKSYFERTKVKDNFSIINGENLNGKNILLADDICTTGSSLKAAIELIKPYSNRKIKMLVIAKRELSKKELEKMKDKSFVLS